MTGIRNAFYILLCTTRTRTDRWAGFMRSVCCSWVACTEWEAPLIHNGLVRADEGQHPPSIADRRSCSERFSRMGIRQSIMEQGGL